MGGKSKAPKAPNYAALAQQQAALDRQTWEQQLVGQSDQYGTSSWSKDPVTGKYTQNNVMSDELKQQHGSAQDLFGKYQGQLEGQGVFQGPDQIEWDPNSGQAASDAMYQSYMSRAGRQQADDQQAMQTQLRQQGLQPGTEAYDRAYKNLLTSQGDVNAKANLDSIVLGGNEARQNYTTRLAGQQQNYNQDLQGYQMPWTQAADSLNMWNSLRSGPSGYSPSGSYGAADVAGAGQKQFESQMAKTNQGNAKKGNTMNAAGGIMGGAGKLMGK
jgi:hypothetical protein